jgi:hypothetical protein
MKTLITSRPPSFFLVKSIVAGIIKSHSTFIVENYWVIVDIAIKK